MGSSRWIERRLRQQLYDHLQSLSTRFFVENKLMYGRPLRRPVHGYVGELAARGVSFQDRDLDLALLLGAEGLRTDPTAEARSAYSPGPGSHSS